MAATHNSIRVPLGPLNPLKWGLERRLEPITIGVPIPAGLARATGSDPARRAVQSCNAAASPRARYVARWIDPLGARRSAGRHARAASDETVGPRPDSSVTPPENVRVSVNENTVRVDTAAATFGFEIGGAFPFSSIDVGSQSPIDISASGLQIDTSGTAVHFRITDVQVHESGPVRAEIELRAGAVGPAPIDVSARIELFAGSATARLHLTLLNRRRARHPNGQWVLGDEGSVYLRSAALVLAVAGSVDRVRCAAEEGRRLSDVELPFELFQESSGGDHWNGPIHRNRDGGVPLRFRGYRLRSGASRAHGPSRDADRRRRDAIAGSIAVTAPRFWQNFPRAISVDGRTIEIGLFPGQAAEPHELQGGEQKTHDVVIAFGERCCVGSAARLVPRSPVCVSAAGVVLLERRRAVPDSGVRRSQPRVSGPRLARARSGQGLRRQERARRRIRMAELR